MTTFEKHVNPLLPKDILHHYIKQNRICFKRILPYYHPNHDAERWYWNKDYQFQYITFDHLQQMPVKNLLTEPAASTKYPSIEHWLVRNKTNDYVLVWSNEPIQN